MTACAQTDVVDGWREHRRDGGVVIDLESDEVIAQGLSLPRHDPTFAGLALQEKLNAAKVSARCDLLIIDLRTGDAVEWLRLADPVGLRQFSR